MKKKAFVFYSIILIFGIAISAQATPIHGFGSITFSLILTDNNGNITDGSGNEGQVTIRLSSPKGTKVDLEFETPLLFNNSAFDDGIMNSQSIIISDLPIYTYYYTVAIMKGNWTILGYNDQLVKKANSLDDFYPYDIKNLDSNGVINLALTKGPERELVILVGSNGNSQKTSSIPTTPEPGTILMVGAGSGLMIARRINRWRKSKTSQKIL